MDKRQTPLRRALDELLGRLEPGARLLSIRRMGADEAEDDEGTAKGIGYGAAILMEVAGSDGKPKRLVFRTGRSDQFGHDKRADRAANALLDFDTTGGFPSHARVVDVGAIQNDGRLESLGDAGEFYTIAEYLPGEPYAEDLRRIGREAKLQDIDRRRCKALAEYLAEVHAVKIDDPAGYRRAIRDLIGHGEGLFGLADSFEADAPGAPLERVRRIEARAAEWRWRLRGRERRLSRTHGDFHPFNILFDGDARPLLLDASRGCKGDPADDVTCLALNYLFFALEHREAGGAFLELWRSFWGTYLEATGDEELREAAPPYVAWRTLVLVNPLWYPNAEAAVREGLLGLAERALENGHFDPQWAEAQF